MDETDALEFWNESAAIMQFDGGRNQPDAEYYAAVLMRRYAEAQGIRARKLTGPTARKSRPTSLTAGTMMSNSKLTT
jgi:hypothetical protein